MSTGQTDLLLDSSGDSNINNNASAKSETESDFGSESHNPELELECLGTQIGGHSSRIEKYKKMKLGIYDLKNGLILKTLFPPPRGPRELNFYQNVFSSECTDSDLIELRTFIPTFFGTEEKVNTRMMKLANLTSQFKKPCVMDVKMGKVTYDQDASAEKIYYEEIKFPPLKKIGFQITGMIIQNATEKKIIDKHYTRSLTEKTLTTDGLGVFFSILNETSKKQVIHGLISRLKKLEDWFLKQKRFSFIASSLLFIYEGMNDNPVACSPVNKVSDVWDNSGSERTSASESSNENSLSICGTRKRSHDSITDCDGGDCDNKSESNSSRKIPKGNREASQNSKCNLEDQLETSVFDNSICGPAKDCERAETDGFIPEFSVHLIDFAHVFPASTVDENFLFGLQNLITSLHKLAE